MIDKLVLTVRVDTPADEQAWNALRADLAQLIAGNAEYSRIVVIAPPVDDDFDPPIGRIDD